MTTEFAPVEEAPAAQAMWADGAARTGGWVPPASRSSATIRSAMLRTYRDYAPHRAVLGRDGTWSSYQDLGVAARRLAGGLSALGARPGDRVLLVARNCPEWFVVEHALTYAGFVRVPLNHRLRPVEIAAIAADCTARWIVGESDCAPELRAALSDRDLDTQVLTIDGPATEPDSIAAVQAEGFDLEQQPEAEDLAWLPYTSGTTGEPKGVMLAHRSLLACARNLMVEMPPLDPSDVVLHVAPLSHLSGYLALTCALRGVAQISVAAFDPVQTLETVQRHRVSVLPLVPTMLNMLLDEAETGRYDVSSLRVILYAGSAIAPDRLARAVAAFGNVFVQAYGMTEVPFPLAAMSAADHAFDPAGPAPAHLSSAGHVNPFVEVRLVGPDGVDVSPGTEGEIWARGDVIMLGYWGRPEATQQMLRPGGWAATGDVGRMTDGRLYIVDRKKDMIVSGGFNVFPTEIENVISTIDGVDEVAVIGVPDPRWGESVLAVVSRLSGAAVSEDQIVETCRQAIAAYKTPRSVVFVDAIPKTGTGKISRRALRDGFWQGQDRQVGG